MELFSYLFLIKQQVGRPLPLATGSGARRLTDVLVVVGQPTVCHISGCLSVNTVADVMA